MFKLDMKFQILLHNNNWKPLKLKLIQLAFHLLTQYTSFNSLNNLKISRKSPSDLALLGITSKAVSLRINITRHCLILRFYTISSDNKYLNKYNNISCNLIG